MSKSLKDTSTFTALRNSVFRKLWFASVLSGTCVAAHDCAATWVMNKLSPSALFLSLMSTVASLPFFLFTLPAGALADIVDRRKLLWIKWGNAKFALSPLQQKEAVRMVKSAERSQANVARIFDVNRSTICRLLSERRVILFNAFEPIKKAVM